MSGRHQGSNGAGLTAEQAFAGWQAVNRSYVPDSTGWLHWAVRAPRNWYAQHDESIGTVAISGLVVSGLVLCAGAWKVIGAEPGVVDPPSTLTAELNTYTTRPGGKDTVAKMLFRISRKEDQPLTRREAEAAAERLGPVTDDRYHDNVFTYTITDPNQTLPGRVTVKFGPELQRVIDQAADE